MFNLLILMFRLLFLSVVASLLFITIGTQANAQTTSRQGMTISPSSITEQLQTGEKKEFSINLTNSGTESGVLSYSVADAIMNVSTDQRAIFTPQLNSPVKIVSTWIQLNGFQDTVLAANQVATIRGKIQIPENATTGEYYGLITFRLSPLGTNAKSGSVVATEVATKVTLTIGNPKPDGIVGLSINPTTSFIGEMVNFTVNFKNTGNNTTTPKGRIIVLNDEQQPSLVLPINPTGTSVIPGTTSEFTTGTKELSAIGKKQARLELWFGTGSQKQYVSKMITFYRLPQKKVVYIVGSLGIGLPIIGIIHKKRRRKNTLS